VPIYAFDPLQDPRWPEFLERHPGASIFHSRAWLRPLHRTYGYDPIGYTTSPPRSPLANGAVFCRIHSWLTGRRLVSLPFSDHSQPLMDSDDDLHDLLSFLTRDLKNERWKYIELRPLNEWSTNSAGFQPSSTFYFHRLDLRPPLEVIFHNLHKSSTQRKIRRAEREALTYEEGRSETLLRKFYQLLLVTCRRKRLPPQPIAWFRHLIACVGEPLKIYVASKGDRPIAAIMTMSFKRSVVYKYGCSDARFNPLGGMHSLLWRAVADAKRDGLEEFDFGRSDLQTPGLVTFKDRWSTTRSVITYMRCAAPLMTHVAAGRTMRIARQFFARLPDPFLIAAGKTLYRHIG
jgi:hypothetical protein